MKVLSRVVWGTVVVVMGVVLIVCVLFAAMQTKGFKKRIQDYLSSAAQKAGIVFTVGSIEGDLPFQWTLRQVHLELSPVDVLDVDKLTLRIAFFPLLRNELAISYCSFSRGTLLYSEETVHLPDLENFSLPFHFSVRTFKGNSLLIENFEKKEKEVFSLRGQGQLKRRAQAFFFNFKLFSEASPASYLQASLKGEKRTQNIAAGVQIKMKSIQLFRPFITLPFETDLVLDASLQGAWKTWHALFYEHSNTSLPLQGTLKTRVHKLEAEHLKILNRKWLANASFSLSGEGALTLTQCSLESNLLKGTVQASFGPSLQPKSSTFHLIFPKLEFLSLYSPISLQGAVTIEGKYTQDKAEIDVTTQNLSIGSQPYETAYALLRANREQGLWTGYSDLYIQGKAVSIESYSRFTMDEQRRLEIEDLFLKGPDTKIGGNLWIDLPKKEVDGAIFGQLLHLSAYRDWAPLHSGLEGAAAVYIDFKKRSTHLHLLLNDLHYFKTSAQEIVFDGTFTPSKKGKLSLEATQLQLPQLEVASLSFQTDSFGPYHLFAKGEWKEPFELHAQGRWNENALHIDTLKGYFLKQAFALEAPFSIQKDKEHLQVSQCDMSLGLGHLKFALDLQPTFSKGYLKALHFPLDLFFISHPSFSLHGMASIDASVQGDAANMQGRLNVLLEQFDLYQCGKTCPLKAKGSLEAHLDRKTMQIHADLKASPDQLFECTATLPLEYTLLPFNVKVDSARPLAAEVTLEGKIEEIFDFINIGSHHVSGHLSSHLLLSRTLGAPLLQGNLQLEKGAYENYYTGTFLKEIEANAIAQGEYVRLDTFQAKDDQGGKATAQGQLWLNFEKKLPYSLQAEIANLNLLRLDSVNSTFTGSLLINGNQESASATGGLLVPKADLSIPEELPIDLPTLPITYINRPSHLSAVLLEPLPIFPFNLDLTLTAPGPIYLRGRGLRSEWKGNAQITGTNTDFAASGELVLTKGEFLFSGKGFNLTQGEISLTAKPTQSAYLKLRGELQLSDVTIIALLNGPLTAPILTFQSIPHMPTSSLLSRILFNKDISEITPIQALQLAQTIVTLSGGAGPDVLEKIRKSLGVDRLNIVSGQNGSDQVSVQIGKYLTKGVMVTLSQGVDNSQIIVEVELKHGFLLQAETQEDEEGKFSLKWNKNY